MASCPCIRSSAYILQVGLNLIALFNNLIWSTYLLILFICAEHSDHILMADLCPTILLLTSWPKFKNTMLCWVLWDQGTKFRSRRWWCRWGPEQSQLKRWFVMQLRLNCTETNISLIHAGYHIGSVQTWEFLRHSASSVWSFNSRQTSCGTGSLGF